MEVQFKKETLFEKFKLSSSLSKGELMRLFQTRFDLRKELSVFAQIINNEQKLYVEELFTTYIENDFYTIEKYLQDKKSVVPLESVFDDAEITSSVSSRKKLAALINLVRNFDYAISKLKISGKIFDELISVVVSPTLLKNNLTHAKVDDSNEIFSAFCESLWKEIEQKIISSINSLNSKTVNATYRVLSAITNASLKKRFVCAFVDAITTSLDSISSRLEDESLFASSIEFVCGLNNSLFKNKEFYYSYKAFCNQLANNVNENGKLYFANFSKLLEKLHYEDAERLCSVFINLCFTYILFDNIEKNTYYELSKMGSVSSVIDYIKDNDIECENIEILEILSALIKNGEEWYNYYRERIIAIKKGTSVSQNLYDLARLLYKSERLKKYRTIFTNLLIALTHFDTETDNLFSNLNRELEKTSNSVLGIYIINNKQNELRNYIIKYYALTILEPKLVKTFEIYKLLTSNSYSVKAYMEKCDAIRSTHGTYARKTQSTTTTSSTTRSYTHSPSSSRTKGKIVCGVLSAIAFIIMIICYACDVPVGGVIFLIGAAKYDDIKGNGKALTAIILIPIILCCTFGPIVGNANSSSNSSSSQSSQTSSNTTNEIVDNKISLTASNFEDYFTITTSGSLSGYSATILYNIKPKNSSYSYDDNSSSSITVKIKVSFYTSQYSSCPVKTGYINVILYKSSGFKKSGSENIYLDSNYNTLYWGTDISSCSGTIGK